MTITAADLTRYQDLAVAAAQAAAYAATLQGHQMLVARLLSTSDGRRVERADDVAVTEVGWVPGSDFVLAARGGAGRTSYYVRISLGAKPSHRCTCPDWRFRAATLGPCKHVLAVAVKYQEDMLRPEMERALTALKGVVEPQPASEPVAS